MRTRPSGPNLVLLLACVLTLLLFLLDIAVPAAHFWGRYLVPLLIVFLWGRNDSGRRDIFVVTALACVLIVADYWLEGAGSTADFLLEHVLPVAVLLLFAWVLAQRQRAQERLLVERAEIFRHRQELEQQAAARARLFLSALVASSPEAVVGRTVDGTILSWNRSAERLFGYTAEEAIGQNFTMLAAPGALPHMEEVMAAVAEGIPVEGVETQRMAKDGRIFDCQISSFPVYSPEGEILGVASFTHDISQRKAAERARQQVEAALAEREQQLRASELKWRSVFEFLPVGVSLVNRQDQVTDTNSALAQILHMTHEGILEGRYTRRRYFHPDRTPMAPDEFPSQRALREGQVLRDVIIGIEKEDGALIWVSVSATPESLDGYAVTVTADVTARHQAEAQTRETLQRLRLAADAAAIGVWNWNFADDSLEWDDRICDFYAVPRAMRAGGIYYAVWRERVHPDDLAANEASLAAARRDGTEWSSTFRIVLPSGEVRHIYSACVVERDGAGAATRMVGINRDVTDQVRYEQLLQDTNAVLEEHVAARTAELRTALAELQRAGKLKDEFLAIVSHELRTPLMGVLSMAEMLEDQIAGPLNARQATYVKSITHSGERLLALINGILGYTHLLSGKVQLQPEPCGLAELLDICAASQRYKAAAKRQVVVVTVAPPDLVITADAIALAEVLKRLLDNAVKFTPDGGQIGLEAHLGAAPHTVDLVVWDTGIGIPADQLDRVFHAFTQADARLSRSHEGLGLGLAYVDEMVRLMGGTIACTSTPGAGSRFIVTLGV